MLYYILLVVELTWGICFIWCMVVVKLKKASLWCGQLLPCMLAYMIDQSCPWQHIAVARISSSTTPRHFLSPPPLLAGCQHDGTAARHHQEACFNEGRGGPPFFFYSHREGWESEQKREEGLGLLLFSVVEGWELERVVGWVGGSIRDIEDRRKAAAAGGGGEWVSGRPEEGGLWVAWKVLYEGR